MIQCVGCRQADPNYCARICCNQSIKNALKLKKINPRMDIYILFRDIRTYGFAEDYYREASNNDVKFIRFEPNAKLRIEAVTQEGRSVLRVSVDDELHFGQETCRSSATFCRWPPRRVIPGAGNSELAQLFKVPLGPDGFFKEAHVKLKPVEFVTGGVFLCGTAHYPKHIPEVINQAYGAAERLDPSLP